MKTTKYEAPNIQEIKFGFSTILMGSGNFQTNELLNDNSDITTQWSQIN